MTLLYLALVTAVAFTAAAATVPLISRFAINRRLLDWPDAHRRAHAKPVPRLGGVAVFAGLLASAGTVVLTTRIWSFKADFNLAPNLLALLAASGILFVIGLLDDLRGVPALLKLVGQTIAALIVCGSGFGVHALAFPPHYTIALGWLSVPITVLWLVGVCNAFNLVDGLDGLAGGVAVIVLATIGAAGAVLGHMTVPFYCAALGGALLGFLRYNWPPARIFLGDSGSLVVGFLLAYLAVKGATREDDTLLTLVPIFALSYPLLDTGISMLRRWLRGDPLSRADGRHIHHQLRTLGLTPRRAAGVIFFEVSAVAALGLAVTFAPPAATVAIAALGAAILLFIFAYGIRWLQYHEFLEASTVVASAGSRMRGAIRDTISARDFARLITAASTLEEINAILEDAAEVFRFAHMGVGASGAHTPAHVLADTPLPRVWKAEYPVITPDGDAMHDVTGERATLTIWCTMAPRRAPATSVERVASILASAIAVWSVNSGVALMRRTAPRRVYSPALGHRVVPGKILADLTISGSFPRERHVPLH